MIEHTIVSHEEWVGARRRRLAKEKDFLRLVNQSDAGGFCYWLT